jgi:phosphoribosylglycinamide formyltransferase-1
MTRRIAILGSGSGSNALNILHHFNNHPSIEVVLIASNVEGAGIFNHAHQFQLPSFLLTPENFKHSNEFLEFLEEYEVDFIILAGFLWKVPASLCQAYQGKMLNIHPALLPKYGGKGMYGHHVHEAVCAAHEQESGITIHEVNEVYDEGQIVFQAKTELTPEDTPQSIESKVRILEIKHFPSVIEKFILDQTTV